MIVVDTVILSHFLIRSEETDEVVRLYRHDSEWVAPILWKSEFLSVVSKYVRTNNISLSTGIAVLALAEEVMESRILNPLSETVLSTAVASECSTYDCEYIVLAQQLGCTCVTYDKKMLRAFPQIALHPSRIA